MKIFEIREFIDGGPNDHGSLIGYIKADNIRDAKKNFVHRNKHKLSKGRISNILNTGFFQAFEITKEEFDERKLLAYSTLNMYDI